MNFTLAPHVATEAGKGTLDVIAGGKKVGKVIGRPDYYHAVLRVIDHHFNAGLAQGFGATPEAAIADAFARTRAEAEQFFEQMDALEVKVMGGAA